MHYFTQVFCKGIFGKPPDEGPSLETSKFSLYFSGSCIPINPKLSTIPSLAYTIQDFIISGVESRDTEKYTMSYFPYLH